MKSREISGSKIGPFLLACTDPYIGIGWENQSNFQMVLIGNEVEFFFMQFSTKRFASAVLSAYYNYTEIVKTVIWSLTPPFIFLENQLNKISK